MSYSEGINPFTGEYYYKEYKKPKKAQVEKHPAYLLNFDKSFIEQCQGLTSAYHALKLERCRTAFLELFNFGCLPDRKASLIEKQIRNKALRCMKQYRNKHKTQK